jgi:hypothetical protein
MRNKLFRAFFANFLAVVIGAGFGAGCVTSERKAARSIDHTDEIIKQASAIITNDKELKNFPIVVDGFHNNMWVKGDVATAAQKSRVEKIVWAVPGVRSVENNLNIVSPGPTARPTPSVVSPK